MNAQEIRRAYINFFEDRGHKAIPRALLVPQNDPTTLFTGSGMQPLVPYLLGEEHPYGTRLVDSQPVFRAQDIEEVGDNRHDTLFEMLGNWSLGDYFRAEQLPWIWEFFTQKVGLDPQKLFVTCFIGDEENNIPRDNQSSDIWKESYAQAGIEAQEADLGSEKSAAERGIKPGERIFYYDVKKNWWSRAGVPADMPVGEPGGTTSEVFYEFDFVEHNSEYGKHCHPNCDCGRFVEIGNSVFMEYVRSEQGFVKLPKQNVDCGVGLERVAMAALNSPDVYKISILWPVVEKLEALSGKKYDSHTNAMRVIADHLRGAMFLAVDGVVPSNKEQGYVMRRLMRRAIRFAFDLGIEQNFIQEVAPVIADMYHEDFPEVAKNRLHVTEILIREEKAFRNTLRKGLKELERISKEPKMAIEKDGVFLEKLPTVTTPLSDGETPVPSASIFDKPLLTGADIFKLQDTFGFPYELSLEEAARMGVPTTRDWKKTYSTLLSEQRARSQTAAKGTFKGGLGGHTLQHKKYHTATHLMYQALRDVLGKHVVQRGSNITEERLRFDFSHDQKVTPEQIKQVEHIVNEQIKKDLQVSWAEYPTEEATGKLGALGQFGDRYGDTVKVYTMIADGAEKPFSFEICGGPHVDHTLQLTEDGKKFKILKEEASSAGVRRIKAVLV